MGFKHLTPGGDAAGTSAQTDIDKLRAQLAAAEAAAAASTAQEPEPEPEPEKAIVAQPEAETETEKAVSTDTKPKSSGDLLAALGIAPANVAASMELITAPGSGGGAPFPVLQQAGGNSSTAGGLTVPEFVDEKVRVRLPEGKKPFDCVFLGYRIEVTAWPVGFAAKGGEGDGKSKPCWSAAVSPADAINAERVRKACENYQFTKGALKDKFDWDNGSGAGHPRPQIAILAYIADVDDVVEIRTASHWESMQRTVNELKKFVDPQTGVLNPFPATVKMMSEQKTINGNDIRWHWFGISQALLNEQMKALWGRFTDWYKRAAEDPEVKAKIKRWMECTDRPVGEREGEALVRAANA